MKKLTGITIYSTAIFLLLTGCAPDITPTLTKQEKEIASPFEEVTRYSNALRHLGEMITAYEGDPIKIQSKFITNDTSSEQELPKDISRMLITAVNKIGENIIYVPYDPQYLLNEAQTGAQINRVLPDIVISGAITEFDKDVYKKNRGLNADFAFGNGKGDTDIGYSQSSDKSNTKIALDLHLLNYKTMTMFPSLQTQNSIILYRRSKEREFGFSIFGNGLGFNGSVSANQGKHEALRLLVEFSILELVGKYYNIPYWKLLPNGKKDEMVIAKEKRKFRSIKKDKKLATALIQRMLYLHGYKIQTNGIYNKKTQETLKSYVKDYKPSHLKKLGINEETYISLFLTLPVKKAVYLVENERFSR